MASLRYRVGLTGKGKWHVSIRIKGKASICRSFETKEEAEEWGNFTEKSLRNPKKFRATLNNVFDRYCEEILPQKSKNAQDDEPPHIRFWKEYLGGKFIDEISVSLIDETANLIYEIISKKSGQPLSYETRRKYLMTLSYAFTVASKNWNWIDYNPVFMVNKHVPSKKKQKDTFQINITCPIRKVFLDGVYKELEIRNLSIGGLARLMKCAKSTAQSIFNPKVNITLNMMIRVCQSLGKKFEFQYKD